MDFTSRWMWHNVAESSILMHESILLFFAQSLLSWQHDTTFFWLPRLYSLKASFETIRKVTEAKPGKSRYDKELDDGWCGDYKKWSYDHAALTLSSKETTTKWCLEDATLLNETLRFYREVLRSSELRELRTSLEDLHRARVPACLPGPIFCCSRYTRRSCKGVSCARQPRPRLMDIVAGFASHPEACRAFQDIHSRDLKHPRCIRISRIR